MDKAAMDADRNLIVAVDELVAGPGTPRKGTAQSLGYVLHIANGDVYYQPETAKSRAQILAEVRAVSSSGVVPRDVGPLRLASFIAEGGAGLLKLRRAPPSRLAGGVRVVPCSSIENPLTH